MSSADENAACMNSVYEFMQELNTKHENYQNQFTEIKNSLRLIEYSDAIEDSLRTYIEQQPSIRFLRLKCELKQTLINNDYQDQMFELNYRQHHPTEHQQQLAKRLYDMKFALEKAKQRVAFLKQCIGSNIPPKSFNSLDNIALPSFIRSSRRLADQHGKIIQRTKTDLFTVFIQGAESTMRQYQQQF
ncbi:unnamed protein product, partial [Didymodactylos carnosus]